MTFLSQNKITPKSAASLTFYCTFVLTLNLGRDTRTFFRFSATNLAKGKRIIRNRATPIDTKVFKNSDFLLYQNRGIDNKRLVNFIATILDKIEVQVKNNLRYVLDLDDNEINKFSIY